MNQAEQQVFLDAAEKAFVTFQQCTPDFVFGEDIARAMAETLRANGLDPRKPEHLTLAWSKLRSAPTPAPVSEPVDELEKQARDLIASGLSLQSIDNMSNNSYELASRSPAFCRAVEILTPKREAPVQTRGDAVLQANIEERLRQVAVTQRAAYDVAPPTSGVRSSVQNDSRQIPLPKFATQAQLAAQIKSERENEALILEHRENVMQRRRELKHRQGKR